MQFDDDSIYQQPWYSVQWGSDGSLPTGVECGEIFAPAGTLIDEGLPTERVVGRLSDHIPLTTRFGLVRLREPSRYHAELPHQTTLRVTGVNAQGQSDCWKGLCNPLDMYVSIDSRVDESANCLSRS